MILSLKPGDASMVVMARNTIEVQRPHHHRWEKNRPARLLWSTPPHILYYERGLELKGDPYQVNLIPSKNAEDTDGFRKFIKQSFNAMLNATNEMQRAPRGSQLGHWGVTWKQVVKEIKDRHPDIEGQFLLAASTYR